MACSVTTTSIWSGYTRGISSGFFAGSGVLMSKIPIMRFGVWKLTRFAGRLRAGLRAGMIWPA